MAEAKMKKTVWLRQKEGYPEDHPETDSAAGPAYLVDRCQEEPGANRREDDPRADRRGTAPRPRVVGATPGVGNLRRHLAPMP